MEQNSIYKKHSALQQVFQKNLKSEISTASIDSLTSLRYKSKVVSDPYYQRNYVWQPDKATYFIESIFLGTEIPPLVFYKANKIEIIDGKQRYETIVKFLNGELKLSSKGLSTLKYLANKTWKDLDTLHIELFLDTNLRVIEFSIVSEHTDIEIEDKVKKEIFRRYNSGITPLKTIEVEKAKYIDNGLNNHFKQSFKSNIKLYKIFSNIFMTTDPNISEPYKDIEKALQKIRQYLIVSSLPITYIANANKNAKEKYFELISENSDNFQPLFNKFEKNVLLLEKIKNKLQIKERLLYECLYWILEILDKENQDYSQLLEKDFIIDFKIFLEKNLHYFDVEQSHFYKNTVNRYEIVGKYFATKYEIKDINIYIYSNKHQKKESTVSSVDKKLPEARTQRPNATDISIDSLIGKMKRQNFLIRPAYQRVEVINKQKSSSIIESILLDIKLPAIFVHKRDDGVLEVIDGQQRLLSILGFMGEGYKDENGDKVFSNKNKFSLSKLSLLDGLDKKKFSDLNDELKDKIYEYKLSIVEISSDLNPDFDPIDLFIRLNQKPYPIKENSFEMLNSYIDKDVIQSIKRKTLQYISWFHFNKNDKRMMNEELFSSLVFLNYQKKYEQNNTDSLKIYQTSSKLNVRLKDKSSVTNLFKKCEEGNAYKTKVLESIKETEKFIKKIEIVLLDKDIEKDKNKYLESELGILFNLKKGAPRKAIHNYYLLWLSISDIQLNLIKDKRGELKNDITELFSYFKATTQDDDTEDRKSILMNKINEIHVKFSTAQRKLKLSKDEINKQIKNQDNICPICNNTLYIGDEVHVDHIIPLIKKGEDSKNNMQIVHSSCNFEKGGKLDYKIKKV